MKRTLTLTFEFDDAPWYSEETGEWYPTDAIKYAMDGVNGIVAGTFCGFVNAKLDDEMLVDVNGFVSEEVKKREKQYRVFMREVMS